MTVPYLDFRMPGDEQGTRRERTITVAMDAPSDAHELDIEEIRLADGKLIVISSSVGIDSIGHDAPRPGDASRANALTACR